MALRERREVSVQGPAPLFYEVVSYVSSLGALISEHFERGGQFTLRAEVPIDAVTELERWIEARPPNDNVSIASTAANDEDA